ncbi:MAG: hypothetical protein K2Y51_10630 [Gammaproteobacteria bacterium]|nr:hypothetical protein [Gammaproteobacteria bacterium]
MAQLLAEILGPLGEIQLRPYADVTRFYQDLSNNELELGLAEEPERPIDGIFWIAAIYPSVLHILASTAQPANDLKQILATADLYTGPPGGVAQRLASSLRHQYRLRPVTAVDAPAPAVPGTSDPAAYFVFGGFLPDDARGRLQGYRLVSLQGSSKPTAQSVADGIGMRFPQFRPFVLPSDIYPELSRDSVQTVAISILLLAGADVAHQAAYSIAELVQNNAGRIADLYPLARQTRDMTDVHVVPIHPGARDYTNRLQPNFLERHANLFTLAVSILAIVASSLAGWWRHAKQKRKDRLDRYYAKALELRAAVTPDNGAAIDAQLVALQGEVLDLLVNEGIDADGSLVALLLLTNRIMDEANARAGG